MFLQPSEMGFLTHLKEAKVPVVEFEFPQKKIINVQSQRKFELHVFSQKSYANMTVF